MQQPACSAVTKLHSRGLDWAALHMGRASTQAMISTTLPKPDKPCRCTPVLQHTQLDASFNPEQVS